MTALAAGRYDTYKASDTEWLGEIPGAWSIVRAKDLFAERNERSLTGEETLLTVSHITGVTPRSEKNVNMFMAETMEGYKVCHQGDLVINTMWAWMGALGTSPYDGICSPSYGVYAPRKGVPYCARYYDYVLRTPRAVVEMTRFSKGIVSSRLRLYSDKFFQIGLPLPDLATQQAIADYLEAKTAQIDRKIDLLTQKAAKYSQLKQSLINEAVTRGLDKSAPMKDSGIGWIGEVPAHWRIVRLKDVAELRYSNVDKLSKEDEVSVALCNYVDVYKNDFIDASLPFMTATADAAEIKRFSLRQHDVLVTKDSETADDIAVPALVLETLPGVLCGYHLAQLRSRKEVMYGPYLFRLFQADNYGHRFATHAKGITRVGLSMSAFADALTPVPPYDEQMAISKHVDAKAAEIDDLIAVIGHQIDKLKELRKALINDVVTGKLRVA